MSDRCQTRNVGSLELIQWQLARLKIAWLLTRSRSSPVSLITVFRTTMYGESIKGFKSRQGIYSKAHLLTDNPRSFHAFTPPVLNGQVPSLVPPRQTLLYLKRR